MEEDTDRLSLKSKSINKSDWKIEPLSLSLEDITWQEFLEYQKQLIFYGFGLSLKSVDTKLTNKINVAKKE